LGLATKLSDYNIPKEDIPGIVEKAVGKNSGELYDQVVQIMEKAFSTIPGMSSFGM
jgi:hypothetical protein